MTDTLHSPVLRGSLRAALVLLSAACLFLAFPQIASAELAGRYKVGGTRAKVKVKSWGEDCGRRPSSSSSRGGKTVEVRRSGAHLLIGGQRTDRCWSRNPRVQRRSASATAGRWQVVCETPADDPRYERGEYTIEALGTDTLRFVEQSRYNWRLEGDHCEAIVYVTRTYTREEEEAPSDSTEPDRPTTPTPRRCAEPGKAVRLELRPARAAVAPGERICLRAYGRDEEGCRVTVEATFERGTSGPPGRLGSEGCLLAGTELGRVPVTATAGSLTATGAIDVRHPDIGDLVAASLGEGGEDEAALPEGPAPHARPGAVQGVGGASSADVPEGSGLLWVVLGAAVAAALLLGVLAAVLLRRGRRRETDLAEASDVAASSSKVVASATPPPTATEVRSCPTCHREFDGETFFCPHDATELVAATESEGGGARGENRICPKCRRGFPPSAKVCPTDKEELVPYSVWRATQLRERSVVESTGGRICPKCAAKYDQDVQYCQKDGAKLVPIN